MNAFVLTYQPLFDFFLFNVGFAFSQQIVLRAGVFSIGSAGFASIGAYAVGILVRDHSWNAIGAVALALVFGAAGGFLLSVPLARLRGVFQAIATLAFVQIVVSLALYLEDLTGGPQGFNNIPKLVQTWHLALVKAIDMAVEEGHLRTDTDAQQLLFEVHALILALHHDARFLRRALSAGARGR